MRNLLAFLGAMLVAFLALGWHLDWYRVSRPSGGTGLIEIDVNPSKVRADVVNGVEQGSAKLQQMANHPSGTAATTPAPAATGAAPTPAPAPAPGLRPAGPLAPTLPR